MDYPPVMRISRIVSLGLKITPTASTPHQPSKSTRYPLKKSTFCNSSPPFESLQEKL